MNSTQVTGLAKMAGLMETFRQLDPEIPAHTVLAFLMVAQSMPQGILQNDLGRRLNLSSAGIARNVMYLSSERGIGIPGFDLVSIETVREDRRLRRVKLSSKGEKFLSKLMKQLD